MARSIVRTDPFKPSAARLEQIINRLERELDKDTAHLRAYRDAINDIDLLHKAEKIDADHADIWKAKAQTKYEAVEQKIQDKKQKELNPYYKEGEVIYPFFYSFFKRLFKQEE